MRPAASSPIARRSRSHGAAWRPTTSVSTPPNASPTGPSVAYSIQLKTPQLSAAADVYATPSLR